MFSCFSSVSIVGLLWWFERKWPQKGMALMGVVVWLKSVRPFWKKCVTVAVGFEVYAQAIPNEADHFLLPADQDGELSARAKCLPACHQVPP